MSAIADFNTKLQAHFTAQDAAIDGLVGDIKTLNDTIRDLQSTSGSITPDDQRLLDVIEARGKAIGDKLGALDAQTPPALPPPVVVDPSLDPSDPTGPTDPIDPANPPSDPPPVSSFRDSRS